MREDIKNVLTIIIRNTRVWLRLMSKQNGSSILKYMVIYYGLDISMTHALAYAMW